MIDILKEQSDLMAHSHHFFLWPVQWQQYRDNHDWKIIELRSDRRNRIPSAPGIYSLVIQPSIANHPACSYLMYIGKASSLKKRYSDYLYEKNRETGRPKIFRMLNLYEKYVFFCYTFVDKSKLDTVEQNLINAFLPPKNDQYTAEISKVIGAF